MVRMKEPLRTFFPAFLALAVLLSPLVLAQATGQGLSAEERRKWVERYVREITAQEAQRWVASQGTSFLYIGSKELFPGLGKALKGKQVKVYVGEGTKTIPWMESEKARYTLFEMPGRLTSDEGILIALNGYVLGKSRERKGMYVLVMSPEVANVLYRALSVYEAFARAVLER